MTTERFNRPEPLYDLAYGENAYSILAQIVDKFSGLNLPALFEEYTDFSSSLEALGRLMKERFPVNFSSNDLNVPSDILFQLNNIDNPQLYTCRLPAYLTALVLNEFIPNTEAGVANDYINYNNPTHLETVIVHKGNLWTINYGFIARGYKVKAYEKPSQYKLKKYNVSPQNIAALEKISQQALKRFL